MEILIPIIYKIIKNYQRKKRNVLQDGLNHCPLPSHLMQHPKFEL